ncbi:unnamed protein product [Medioppia subpectinata]|uniref:Sulfatase N-terminal domain-containing protein n=1 Tax=Medioppia subpectinata TaxID=1979941 RepID=A0A7R9KQJ3_9ACAR|nr:unnamed protein product [Medioppia subpectinata]CAG2106577.1 unnamed protein product [Medioppia subpectinata]
MRGTQVIEQPVHLEGITDRLVNEATGFMSEQNAQQKPFLLVLNFIKVHTAHFPNKHFKGKSGFGKYGDCVLEMDDGIGKILDYLREYNLRDNTFVYFSSDNGGHLEEVGADGVAEGGSNGIYKGGKGHGAMEGGIRVPTAVMWPNKIPPQAVISVPTSQMDVFSTVHEILRIPEPNDRIIDGKSMLSLLLKPKSTPSAHQFLFHYCGTYLHGVRYVESADNIWKLYFSKPKYKPGQYKCQFMCMCFGAHVVHYNPPLLYNIASDPGENISIDINSDIKYQRIVDKISEEVKNHKQSVASVPSQFDFENTIWRPWLQPCCQFPTCSCSENQVKK